jgi:glycosyltransferase involved in cell wall biosynthesis
MENKKKLWVVSELFYPDVTSSGYYLTEIAKKLAQTYMVNVICGPVSYEKKYNLKEDKEDSLYNISIHRVNVLSLDKNKLLFRILRLLNITLAFSYQLFIKIKKGDQVLLVTNPAFLIPIAAFFSKIKGFQLTILVHDVFPENLIPVNLINPKSIIYRSLKLLFDKTYRSVNQIIVCGRDMELLFKHKTENKGHIFLIENWADIDTVYPDTNNQANVYQDLGLEDKIIFQYAGNIGRLQGLEELIDIFAGCTNPSLHLILVGEGAMKSALQMKVNEQKISNVSFFPSFDRSQQNIFLNACDVGVVSLLDNMLGLGVPSKSYNIIAAGKPILFLGNKNSEVSLMIQDHSTGWEFELTQKAEIIDFLNKFDLSVMKNKGFNARIIAEKYYAKDYILNKYQRLINGEL